MEIRQTPVGSLPRSKQLQDAYAAFNKEELGRGELDQVIESEIKDVVSEYEKIENNPLITTGEVEKPNFLTYFLDNGFIKLGDPSPEDAEGFVIDLLFDKIDMFVYFHTYFPRAPCPRAPYPKP